MHIFKRIFIALAFFPLLTQAQNIAKSNYRVNVEVNFPKGDETGRTVYFAYQQNGQQKLDSAILSNNKCSFSGMADLVVKTSVQFTKPNTTPEPALDPNTLSLYLGTETTEVKATGFLMRGKVTGSAMQEEYAAFLQKYSKWDRTITGATRRKRNLAKTDTLKLLAANKTIDSAQNVKMSELCIFLDQNISKPYAVDGILMYLRAKGSSLDINKAQRYFKQLPPVQQQSASGHDIEALIADLKKK